MIRTQLVKKEAPLTSSVLNHVVAYDAIRLFAVFSVIAVHVATPVVANYNSSGKTAWWAGNLYESLFRSGIPLFLMLTGVLLLPKANGLRFVRNRILRICFPLLFWTFVFLIAKNKLKEIELEDYVYSLLHGSTYYFWYVYFILLVYTLMPLLRILVKYFQPSVNQILLLICITTFVLKLLPSDVQLVNTIINYLIYLQYIVFGYCLTSGSKTWWQNNIYFGLLLVVSGFVITLFGTYFLSDKTGEFQDFFYQSSTTHIFLKAVGIWILFNRLTASIPANAIALLRMLSKFSFGIFLIHQLVIENVLIVRLGISHNFIHPAVGMLLTTVLCFIISSFILYILTKLQLGKYVC